jgi:uncharacterized oligopeptide transporter (OPT) family protein
MSPQVAPQPIICAMALSILLAMILAAANTYLGLFAGLTIASAKLAAVASMAVLHAFGGGHILENNIVQTGASAAASIAAGVIFTIPALVIIGEEVKQTAATGPLAAPQRLVRLGSRFAVCSIANTHEEKLDGNKRRCARPLQCVDAEAQRDSTVL